MKINTLLFSCLRMLLIMMLFGCLGYTSAKASTVPNNLGNKPDMLAVSSYPVLTWMVYPDAVMYELEIARDKDFSRNHVVFHSDSVYVAGYQPDLSNWLGWTLFYRIRPLDYDRHPIGEWGNVTKLQIAYPENFNKFQPVSMSKWSKTTPILYPAYSWIPIFGAEKYKVEVFSVNTAVTLESQGRYRLLSRHVVEGSLTAEWYDEVSRVGNFAWRVQALDKNDQPIGQASDLEEFSLTAVAGQFALGVFGDSIIHGGGAVSGSPADFCYSLHNYLAAPAVNLGKSGDTSKASLERFDTDVLPFLPKSLLILTGINSIRGGEKAENVIQNLADIYAKCKKNKISPIFLTLTPINPERIQLIFGEKSAVDWQKEQSKVNQYIMRNLPYIDIAPLFTGRDGKMPVKWSTDGLHPDSKAKKLIADKFNHSQFNVTK